jgi:hypothetical protein
VSVPRLPLPGREVRRATLAHSAHSSGMWPPDHNRALLLSTSLTFPPLGGRNSISLLNSNRRTHGEASVVLERSIERNVCANARVTESDAFGGILSSIAT